MIDPKRIIALLRVGDENSNDILNSIYATYRNIALTTLEHSNKAPTKEIIEDVIDVVAEHIRFTPTAGQIYCFLNLHPKLKSRVIEWGADDTEVRSEITDAIAYFTLGTSWADDESLHLLIAIQWNRTWADSETQSV